MSNSQKITRRRFFELSVLGAGGVFILSRCTASTISQWRFFSVQESRLMDALAEQIIPSDDWPGGKDADVTNFIDIQLSGPYTRYRETYRKGLKSIQETCQHKFQTKFEELPFDEQTHFLETMEAGKMEGERWKDGFDREFFGLIREHSMQGFYGSPRHGGNRNNVSYKMIRLDYPLIISQNRYKT